MLSSQRRGVVGLYESSIVFREVAREVLELAWVYGVEVRMSARV